MAPPAKEAKQKPDEHFFHQDRQQTGTLQCRILTHCKLLPHLTEEFCTRPHSKQGLRRVEISCSKKLCHSIRKGEKTDCSTKDKQLGGEKGQQSKHYCSRASKSRWGW